ncbi:MAG: type II secretion system F family protein [Desulfobacteraceae bacterium]|jgi:type II secretory pathway component PulF
MAITSYSNKTDLQPRGPSAPKAAPGTPTGMNALRYRLLSPVKSAEVTFFTTQLALMLEVGTPLNLALNAVRRELSNPFFDRVLSEVSRDIEQGRQFSDALARHPKVFDNIFINMVRAGEAGGFLRETLERLVRMQEKRQALRNQLRSAMTYPVVLTLLGVLVVVFIMVGVLPKFVGIFEGKEEILPLSTRFLMAASASLRQYWLYYLAGCCAGAVGIKLWAGSAHGRVAVDRLLIHGPVVSHLSNQVYTSEMLRTMGYLLESRVPLLQALRVTGPTVRNSIYRKLVVTIEETVSRGERFAHPFGDHAPIPPTVKQMVAVAEEVGQLPKVMLRLAKYYDGRVDEALKRFVAIIEPLALIVLGGIVGVIVSSIVLPLFRLSRALH